MKSNFKKAFTLAELMITLVVLGIIAAIVIPSMVSKATEKAKQTKIKKAMANYESTVRNIIAEQQLKYFDELTDLNDEGCEAKVKYFKTVETDSTNPCIFKTADGLWWNITYIENPYVAFKREDLTVEKANAIADYGAFYFATSFYDDANKFIVDDLSLETGSNKNYMTKLYGFLGVIEKCTDAESCFLSGAYETGTECNDKTGTCNCYTKSSDDYWAQYNIYDGNCKTVQQNYYCDENGTNCEQECYTEEIPHLANKCAYCYGDSDYRSCNSYDSEQCTDNCYCNYYGYGSTSQEAIENKWMEGAYCTGICINSPSSGKKLCTDEGSSYCYDAEMSYCYPYDYYDSPTICDDESTTEKCGETINECYKFSTDSWSWELTGGNSAYTYTDDCSARCTSYNDVASACFPSSLDIDWDSASCDNYSYSYSSYSYSNSYCNYTAQKEGMDYYNCYMSHYTSNYYSYDSASCSGYGYVKDQNGNDAYVDCSEEFDRSTGQVSYSSCYGYGGSFPQTEIGEDQYGSCYGDFSGVSCTPDTIYKYTENGSYNCFSEGSYCCMYDSDYNNYADMYDCSIVSGERRCTTCDYGNCDYFKKTDESGNVYYTL